MDDHPRNHDEPMMNLLTMPRYPATPVMETSLRLANVTPRKVLAWELQWLLTQYSTVYPCNSMYIKICSQHIAIFIFIIFKRIANHQPKRTSQANMSSIKNCKQKTGWLKNLNIPQHEHTMILTMICSWTLALSDFRFPDAPVWHSLRVFRDRWEHRKTFFQRSELRVLAHDWGGCSLKHGSRIGQR